MHDTLSTALSSKARRAKRCFPFQGSLLFCAAAGKNRRMIQETIGKIEERLRETDAIQAGNKAELLNLLSTLKAEVSQLSRTNSEQAESIAGFTAVSTHEAMREERNPQLVQISLQGLASSVEGFERSHPRLVEVVNSICTTLSNLGI